MTRKLHRTTRRTSGRLRIGIGGLLLIIAGIGVAYPLWWNHRSSVGATHILKQEHKALTTSISKQVAGKSCLASPGPGVLQIPSLGLTAPVQQGLTNPVLDVSIGHDPATPWPGPNSAALFAAHDVSFFSHLNQLKAGDVITYTVPCATYTFTVSAEQVTSPGASISVPKGGGLVLDTCWPTNALWFTPDRYVVSANYVSTKPQSATVTNSLPSSVLPALNLNFPAPQGLSPSDLQLSNNSQIMGKLAIVGSPSSNFQQSNAPLQLEAAALQGWFASLHTLENSQPSWWKSFAPKVAYPSQFQGTQLTSTSALQISESVVGNSPQSVVLSGGENSHNFTVSETISHGTLTVTGFSVN